jgi:hypothetical protein
VTSDENDEARRKRLRRLLDGAGGKVAVDPGDLRWLLDEVSRLQQGNDRLRRQNRKLRLRRDRDSADGDGDTPPDA